MRSSNQDSDTIHRVGGALDQKPGRKSHWEAIYSDKDSTEVSWYKPHLDLSLSLIKRTGVSKKGHIIDIGAGASTLVDDLIEAGYENITALDISLKALKTAQARLRDKAQRVIWIEADITKVVLHPNQFDLWHDRASFHFLSSREDRQRYVELAERALKDGGHIIISTFALDAPPKCSGLNVERHSPDSLQEEFGVAFELVESITETHRTPFNTEQYFLYCCLKKH